MNNDNKDNEDAFYLDKNTLCVIEIKNQFPPYRSNKITDSNIINKTYPVDFYNMVKPLIKKALVFKEMFEQSNEKIDSIKLLLFYDAVHKINYEKELCKAMNDLFTKQDEKIISLLEFQCIYIKSSYLAGGVSNSNRDINIIKCELKETKNKMEEQQNKMNEQQNKMKEMEDLIKNLKDEINALKESKKESKNVILNMENFSLKEKRNIASSNKNANDKSVSTDSNHKNQNQEIINKEDDEKNKKE